MPASAPGISGSVQVRQAILAGLAASLCLGLALGWLRYWFGFFVLAQGAVGGLLVAHLAGRAGRRPPHPGFRAALAIALGWFAAFLVGLVLGFGLAQPWFEPLGWLDRLWRGRTVELVFGVSAVGPVHNFFAQGAKGWFWLFLNLIDWLIMLVFLLAMPWTGRARSASRPTLERARKAG